MCKNLLQPIALFLVIVLAFLVSPLSASANAMTGCAPHVDGHAPSQPHRHHLAHTTHPCPHGFAPHSGVNVTPLSLARLMAFGRTLISYQYHHRPPDQPPRLP